VAPPELRISGREEGHSTQHELGRQAHTQKSAIRQFTDPSARKAVLELAESFDQLARAAVSSNCQSFRKLLPGNR
jgi:hypothetical protein